MRHHICLALVFTPLLAAYPQNGSPDTLASAIQRFVDARAAADSFSGAVLVARDGKPVLRAAWGSANRETRELNTPATKFNLGSVDKLITRIAIWQLVAAGKLDLDAPIGRYLPDFPNRDVRERVTARQLYTMRSGVGDFFGSDEYMRRHAELRTVDDFLSLFASDPLRFEPGTGMLYSNGGYVILGKLIEKLSGKSYYDYVVDNIAGPLGMTSTRHFMLDERVPSRAIGYTALRGPLQPNTSTLAGRGSPAGGGYSSVDDFLKLDAALRNGRLFPAAFADSILPQRFRSGGTDPIHYGGGGPGTNTQYASFADGYTIIVFANADPNAATDVAQGIAKLLGKTLPSGTRMIRRPGG